MSESILTDVKTICGLAEDYTPFDAELIIHVNSIFMALKQLGVGPEKGFAITGPDETWDLYTGVEDLQAIKTYLGLRVKMLFDPSGSSYVISALEKQVSELEWRLTVEAEEVNLVQ